MEDSRIHVGDILKLKSNYSESAKFAIVLEIQRAECLGDGGWISFDYVVLNEKEQIIRITESCVKEILYSEFKK